MQVHIHIHKHIHHHHDGADEIKSQLNKIVMTTEEAVAKLNGIATQLQKVKAEVQILVDAGANAGNITPELQAAIANVAGAVQGVDDLNADAPPAEPPAEG